MNTARREVLGRLTAWVCMAALAGVARANSGAWLGADGAYWTNSANWSAAPYPSLTDTATFNGAGLNTAIDLAGLSGILNIAFDTAGAASYTLGTGAANSQTLLLQNGGAIAASADVTAPQTITAAIQLGVDRGTAAYSIRNSSTANPLTVNNVAAPASGGTQGTKGLTFSGAGSVSVIGNLMRSGASALTVTNSCAGVLTLSGSNIISTLTVTSGSVDIGAGYLFLDNSGGNVFNATVDTTISGTGKIRVSTNTARNYGDWYVAAGKTLVINPTIISDGGFEMWSGTGTYVLNGLNEFSSNIYFGAAATLCVSSIGNQNSSGNNLGRGQRILMSSSGCKLSYTGAGETTDRIIELSSSATLDHAGTGTLTFTTPADILGGVKTLTLTGTNSGVGVLSSVIGPGAGTNSLAKTGTNTWILSGANNYGGATTVSGGLLLLTGANTLPGNMAVSDGTLAFSGPDGANASAAAISVNPGGTLLLSNTAAQNLANRLSDSGSVYLNGGTLSFEHDAGEASFSENAGTVVANQSKSTVRTARAAEGQTSALTFALGHGAGTIDFVGEGLGESDRNRIFLSGQPDGLIGLWATVNGTAYAAYSSTLGVYAAAPLTYVDIAARGPNSVIPDDAAGNARIATPGEDGPITLETSPVSSSYSLLQNTDTPAVVTTTNTQFKASAIRVAADGAALTIGAAVGDGSLTALATGGDLMLENNSDSSELTVNAAITDNGAPSSLTRTGAGAVRLAGPLSYTGPTAINDGPLFISHSTATQTLAGAVSGTGSLVKEGTGRLTLSGLNTYTGLTTISAGTLLAQTNQAFGSSAAGTIVADGATLDVGAVRAANTLVLGAEEFTVSGAGVHGLGAIINSTNISHYNALRFVTLAGDTTFGGTYAAGRWDIRNTTAPSTLKMNGFNITKTGPNYFGLTGVDVTPGAGNIDVREGTFTVEAGTTMGGDAANTLTVRSGARFDIYSLTTPILWSLVMEDNARFYARQGNTTSLNVWAGSVTLQGRAVFDAEGTFSDTVSGPISGAGSVVKTTANSTTYFTNPNNTYEGATTISNGTLYARHPGSLPGYGEGKLTVANGGTVAVPLFNGDFGWTSAQLGALHGTSAFAGPTAILSVETSGDLDHPYSFTSPMGLTKQGPGVLRIPEGQSLQGQIRVNGYNSELVLNNLSINVTNTSCYIADAATDFARLTVSNGAAWGSYLAPDNVAGPSLYVGNAGRAVLTIDNASLTNRFVIGNAAGSHGAVYQRGANSFVHNWCGRSSDARMGENGYCYYELSGGTLTNNGHCQFGRMPSGVGILAQYGGRMQHGNPFQGDLQISRGGTGLVYIAGGTFASSINVGVGYISDNAGARGFAEFTLAPGAISAYVAGNVNVADRTNMLGVVNLNGGELTANMISKGFRANNVAIVNFNGGTLRARQAGNLFNTGANTPDYVNIYDGGATIDTTNLLCTIPANLLAPAGSGVASIALTPRSGYIGPPFVTIRGGGGTGATAIATFDSVNGMVTGATMTSPGFGYTSNPTVTLSGGGTNIQTTVGTITRAANVSGGLTKLGSGTLTLSGTNTYAGATTVSNGTLRLAHGAAFPAGRAINVHGGTLDLNGCAISNGAVSITSGTIANGWLTGGLTKLGDGPATLSAAFSTPGSILISGGTLLVTGLQPGLYEGRVSGSFDLTAMNPKTATPLGTRYADQYYTTDCFINSGGIWTNNSTYIYSGFLWNSAATNAVWTFSKTFDDSVQLKLDNNTVLYNAASGATIITNYTLTPGPHIFELRLGQGTGAVGPGVAGWNGASSLGVGYDRQGRGQAVRANFVPLADSGDGSLLTLSNQTGTNPIDPGSTVSVASGAALDLGGSAQALSALSGYGLVTNGTLTVTGTLAPGGTNAVGTLTLAANLALNGTLLFDVAGETNSDRVNVRGSLALGPASSLVIANPEMLDRRLQYTVATYTGARTGAFGSVVASDPRWHAADFNDGKVRLIFANGTVLKLK